METTEGAQKLLSSDALFYDSKRGTGTVSIQVSAHPTKGFAMGVITAPDLKGVEEDEILEEMSRALHGANFGDPIQPAPFAQTHFHPFPGFQGKFSPNPLRFHVYEFYINCLLNAKKNSLSFHTNKELKHQDSINMFDRYNGYQMTKS